jgi:restriction endonuclease S subunit
MSIAEQISPKAFAVGFKDLETWSVSAQFAVEWNWPKEIIKPLGETLIRHSESILETLPPDAMVSLLTIHFDGSIEPREPVRINDIKGKLFRVNAGDVIFSKIDVRNGAIGLAPVNIDYMCATSEFPIYSVKTDRVLSEYVKLLFRSTIFNKLLNSMISGTSGRKRIQPSQLEMVKIPVPPMRVQKKIVDYWRFAEQQKKDAEQSYDDIVSELHSSLVKRTKAFGQVTKSKFFLANYAQLQQWDAKAGRAAAFISANPDFVRLGDYTEECSETVRPWEDPEKEWPIYGVNNKDGVFLSAKQIGSKFNAPYKRITKDWLFHNPTRANVGSLGIVPEVPDDAITSPEYQVWRLKSGYLPDFMALMIRTDYFLSLVAFNRVGAVKQRMYYGNLAEIRLPMVDLKIQKHYAEQCRVVLDRISNANAMLIQRKREIEKMILGVKSVEDI